MLALNKVGAIAGRNTNLPILNNVLLKVDAQKAEVSTTNLDLAITVGLRAKIEIPGSFTIPARTLIDFVSLLSEEKIDLELKENELWVKCGKSTTRIKGTSSEDFPIIPTLDSGQEFKIELNSLKAGLSQVLSSVAKNDIRPELSGVFWGFSVYNRPGLTLAATDSYRLAEKHLPLIQGGQGEFRIIVPGRTAQEIYRLLTLGSAGVEESEKNVKILINENQFYLQCGSISLVSRLTEGVYPDYVQIIPKEFKTTTLLSTDKFIKEIKAAGLFTTTGVNAVNLSFKPSAGSVSISSTSTQAGEYVSEIDGELQGGENAILLSYRYLLEGLQQMNTDRVNIKLINADSPCILTPEGDSTYLYIVMPIRQ